VRDLYKSKLVPLTRLNALEREAAALEGQKGQMIAAMAQTQNRIAETKLQVLQIDSELIAETMKELRQIQGELAGLAERRAAAEDQLRRVDITAPATGYVHQLAVHSLGGVVGAGEPAMLIVPSTDRLQVEARVAPQDVDQVHVGQEARLRLHAFNQRTTPELAATVRRVAADISKDPQTGAPYYTVRLTVSGEEAEKVGSARLIAGMQADVFIKTADRTPLDYLLQPAKDQLAKAFRER
jgi:HlyD family secretion protein